MTVEMKGKPLPPSWDGIAVEWRGWDSPLAVTICPPPPESSCPACGMAVPKSHCRGVRRLDIGFHPSLHAFRCTSCGHDQVHEFGGEVWDLEESDYEPAGSWA